MEKFIDKILLILGLDTPDIEVTLSKDGTVNIQSLTLDNVSFDRFFKVFNQSQALLIRKNAEYVGVDKIKFSMSDYYKMCYVRVDVTVTPLGDSSTQLLLKVVHAETVSNGNIIKSPILSNLLRGGAI